MLSKNDKCFFALAFYKQSITGLFNSKNEKELNNSYKQCCYWWEMYQERKNKSRTNPQ